MAKPDILVQRIKQVTVVNFQDASMLDSAHIDRVGEALYKLVDDEDRRQIILDFTDVKFLSSAALGVLVNLQKKAGKVKGQVLICGLRDEIHKVFKITNLDKLFKFHPDEHAALQHFGVYSA